MSAGSAFFLQPSPFFLQPPSLQSAEANEREAAMAKADVSSSFMVLVY